MSILPCYCLLYERCQCELSLLFRCQSLSQNPAWSYQQVLYRRSRYASPSWLVRRSQTAKTERLRYHQSLDLIHDVSRLSSTVRRAASVLLTVTSTLVTIALHRNVFICSMSHSLHTGKKFHSQRTAGFVFRRLRCAGYVEQPRWPGLTWLGRHG